MHWLLLSSLSGGLFILAALVLRSCLKHILPKSFLIKLWAAVLLNFLLLIPLPSPTSIHNYVKPTFSHEHWLGQPPGVGANPPLPASGGAVTRPSTTPGLVEGGVEGINVVFALWLMVMTCLLLYFFVSYMRTVAVFRNAVPIDDEPAIRDWLDTRRGGTVKVFSSDSIVSPVSFGLLRASIILPLGLDMNDPALLRGALEHEYIHCRHMHNLLKMLVYLVTAVHWFNPLVWVFLLLFSHDVELACDERVIQRLGKGMRADYAKSLLSVAGPASLSPRLLSPFSAKNIKERVVNIMSFEIPGFRLRSLETVIVVAAFAIFGTVAVGSQVVPFRTSAYTGIYGLPDARDATDLALSLSGGGAVVKAEAENREDVREYEFIIVAGDVEHKINIDASTMTLIAHEREEVRRYFRGIEKALFISAEQAGEIALRALGGKDGEGEVTGFSLEYDVKSAKFNYEIEILYRGEEHDVEMDAETGIVRKISIDI